MKGFISILLIILLISLFFAGCNNQSVVEKSTGTTESVDTVKQTETKVTEKQTEKQTEAPTEKPTERHEYTAVELAEKSLDEIIDIMGGDYESETLQLSNAFSSSGCSYVYNYDVFPGIAFATGEDSYYGISIMDGAKLNNSISSDMTYDQIADVIGEMDGMFVGQGGNISCSADVDGYRVSFCFIENDYIENNKTGGTITSDVLRAGNPNLQSIGLRTN